MTIKNLIPTYPDIKYVCVGDGEEGANLKNLKNQLGLENQVIFLAKTDEKLKVALLNEANLFFQSAKWLLNLSLYQINSPFIDLALKYSSISMSPFPSSYKITISSLGRLFLTRKLTNLCISTNSLQTVIA